MFKLIPVEGVVTDRFGQRGVVPGVGDAGFHTGDDIAAPSGSVIRAPLAGRVNRSWFDVFANGTGAGGHMVELDHGSGNVTRYAHMVTPTFLAIGSHVSVGDPIGYVGMSGAANGFHLHWEYLRSGSFLSPLEYLDKSATSKDDDMIDSMFAYVNGVPSWCWMNYGTGKFTAVYTQKEADYIGRYMGSVKKNFSADKDRGTQRYADQFAFFKQLT